MTAERRKTEAKQVRLFEERGETSRFVDAEIEADGDLVVSCQDVGKAPLEVWGDSDYEFWVTVASKDKQIVLRAFIGRSPNKGVATPSGWESEDAALLAFLKYFYGGHFHAVDEFRDFLESQGIPCTGGSYA